MKKLSKSKRESAMKTMGKIEKFLERAEKLRIIFESPDLDWQEKYSLIFSENISHQIDSLFVIKWDDPDMDYKDDVETYSAAVLQKAKKLKDLKKLLDCVIEWMNK